MKTTQVNIRLEDREIEILDSMARKGLNRQAVARMLLIIAIDAIQANQGRHIFPPELVVSEGPTNRLALNEPRIPYKTRK